MSLDERIEVLTDLLDRIVESPARPRASPILLTEEVELDSVFETAGRDDARMRTYISKLEDAVRRARIELPPGVARQCFSNLDAWLSQNYWLDFVHR